MARTQREMKLRSARLGVDTQAALALARSHAVSKSTHSAGVSNRKPLASRPQLRIVERQRRLSGFQISHRMLTAYVVGFLALFAAVVMRAEMAATQLHLNSLNSQLSSLETQHLKLEVELSSLEAPSRIVSYAESHLGMVYPAQVGYLGAAPTSATTSGSSSQNQPGVLTQQVLSSPNTLFAPPGEAGGGAPTRPLPSSPPTTVSASKSSKLPVTSKALHAAKSSSASINSNSKTG